MPKVVFFGGGAVDISDKRFFNRYTAVIFFSLSWK